MVINDGPSNSGFIARSIHFKMAKRSCKKVKINCMILMPTNLFLHVRILNEGSRYHHPLLKFKVHQTLHKVTLQIITEKAHHLNYHFLQNVF